MEPFLDGGLFELIIAIVFAYVLNFIFLKKYLLIVFSLISVAGPISLLVISKGELYNLIIGLCIFNALLLNVVLWQHRVNAPDKLLIDIDKYKDMIRDRFTSNSP